MDIDIDHEVFNHRDYRDFLDRALRGPDPQYHEKNRRRPRGAIKQLCEHLRCHSTFISQVLSGTSHLNVDQTFKIAQYFGLSQAATEHFLDLVLLARAGNLATEKGIAARIAAREKKREQLAERMMSEAEMNQIKEIEFFSSWESQAIYSLLNIKPSSTVEDLASRLGISSRRVRAQFARLRGLGLIKESAEGWIPEKLFLHLGRGSHALPLHHRTWRLRALAQHEGETPPSDFHYAGVITASESGRDKIREEMARFLERVQDIVKDDSADKAHALVLDFFGIERD